MTTSLPEVDTDLPTEAQSDHLSEDKQLFIDAADQAVPNKPHIGVSEKKGTFLTSHAGEIAVVKEESQLRADADVEGDNRLEKPLSTTKKEKDIILTSYSEEFVTDADRKLMGDKRLKGRYKTLPSATETNAEESTSTVHPGALRIPGLGRSTTAGSVPEESGQMRRRSSSAALMVGVTVSNKDLEAEMREEILREAVYATEVKRETTDKSNLFVFAASIITLLLVVAVSVAVTVVVRKGRDGVEEVKSSPTAAPFEPKASDDHMEYKQEFSTKMVDGGAALDDPDSVYAQVFQRIVNDPYRGSSIDEFHRFTLSVLFETTRGKEWTNNDNWNTNASICEWYGVTCRRELRHLQEDSLDRSGVRVGLMSYLELPGNNLNGPLLPEIGMNRWTLLNFSDNHLTGTIPVAYATLSGFNLMDFSGNPQLTGEVPEQLCAVAFSGEIKVDCGVLNCSCCTPSCIDDI